jgi:hypothetical protein
MGYCKIVHEDARERLEAYVYDRVAQLLHK